MSDSIMTHQEAKAKASSIFESPSSSQSQTTTQNSTPQQQTALLDEAHHSSGPFAFNKEVLRCQKTDHELARLKFLCTDASCKCDSKLACAECILNDHKDHRYVGLEKFAGDVSEKFLRVSKQAKILEEESQMEEFQKTLNEEVRSEFEEIKQLVLRSFDEFEKDYLLQVQKCFEANRPRTDYREKFQQVVQLATTRFENMDSTTVAKVIDFFQDEKLEKVLDETEKNLSKTKAAFSKKKVKYFEKFRQIVKEILIDCKSTPIKESINTPLSPALVPTGNVQTEEKKKRKITFNDENNQVFEAAPVSQPKQQIMQDLQSFSTRSFAGETRRFTNSVHKKLKTDLANQQQQQQQAQQTHQGVISQ